MHYTFKKIKSKNVVLVALMVIAFLPRLYDLYSTTIYPDEIIWMGRSREVFYALLRGNFDYFNHAWWFFTHATVAIGIPLLLIISPFQQFLGVNPSAYSLNLMPEIVASRLPHAIFMGIFLLFFYYFCKKLTNKYIALLGTILLSFDPVFLQSSRIVLQDAILSAFCFLAICSYFLIKNIKTSMLLTSLFAALAFLAKPTGLAIFAALAVWVFFTKDKREFKKAIAIFLGMYLWVFILWPILWKYPLFIFTYLKNQTTISTLGTDNYYFGQITKSPSMTYYLFQIATRLPAIISVLLVISIRHLKRINKKTFSILFFNLAYFVSMSVLDKKAGARYILPVWPWIYLAASIAFWHLIKNKPHITKVALGAILVIYQLYVMASFFPDYHLFYNSFVGGSKNIHKYDLPDLCYGGREAVEYIERCYPDVVSVSFLGCSKTVAPYYSNLQISTDWQREKLIILEHAYKTLLPDDSVVLEVQKLPLVKELKVKGAPTATIYTNDPNIKNYCQ